MATEHPKLNLSQNQRIIVALIYLAVLAVIFRLIGGKFSTLIWDASNDESIWFYSGAFMIILGSYIVEPFFTKPSDAIANATAVIISLLGLTLKHSFWAYTAIFIYAVAVLALSILSIALKDSGTGFFRWISRTSYWIVETFGASKVIFSVVYLVAAFSYLAKPDRLPAFIGTLAFWICITFFDVVGMAMNRISKLLNYWSHKAGDELGQAIGCDNPLLYNIEIDFLKHHSGKVGYGDLVAIETSQNLGSIEMVINRRVLLNKEWLRIYLLQDDAGEILKIDLKSRKLTSSPKTIFSTTNLVYALEKEKLDKDVWEKISQNPMFKDRDYFIGCVSQGSNINTINFSILRDEQNPGKRIAEGVILKVPIYGQETLYQVINGNTREEHLENFDSHGFTIGIARKLGRYDSANQELNVCKWMPNIYAPLFFAFNADVSQQRIKAIAKDAIGRLPDTDLAVPIRDLDSIVTHNTAILGILGIGKSCLAFELIKRVSDSGVKIFCIDITGQYYSGKGLFGYIPQNLIAKDLGEEQLKQLKASKESKSKAIEGNPQASGNATEYEQIVSADVKSFIEGEAKIKIYNPDWHPVSKGVAFRNTSLEDLTVAEKTRIIAERIFVYARAAGTSDKAKYLLVFEEAHSLVPEWNSVANDGDKNATNGTAKVILQGRKYGLGSLVVTQRTANVSKSILNQCNTIFALRVFDDTGKGFLENYIGQDYADTLPTLEERHAIAIGKGLKLKQPVIIQLNDKDDVATPQQTTLPMVKTAVSAPVNN